MDIPEIDRTPADPAKLSDKELVGLFCVNRKDQALAEEIWRRYGEIIRDSLKRLVFSRNSLCPDSCPRKTFLDASFSRAWEQLFARICTFREFDNPMSLKAWLRRVAYSMAIEEYRDITGSRRDTWTVPIEDAFPSEFDRTVNEEAPVFRSKYGMSSASRQDRGVMAQSPPAPDAEIMSQERKYVIREVLVRYAERSEDDAHSARLIRLRCFLAWELAKIIDYIYGAPESPRQGLTWERAIYRQLAHDYENLQVLLRRDFGIIGPWQV